MKKNGNIVRLSEDNFKDYKMGDVEININNGEEKASIK
jgi:hypothetical protein